MYTHIYPILNADPTASGKYMRNSCGVGAGLCFKEIGSVYTDHDFLFHLYRANLKEVFSVYFFYYPVFSDFSDLKEHEVIIKFNRSTSSSIYQCNYEFSCIK
jgi:hypothetical protein